MIEKKHDVFIAYHGSYDANGSAAVASNLYEFLVKKGFNVFFFPKSGHDSYKQNIVDVLMSKTFILVANDKIHRIEGTGSLDHKEHYELSTEIDAFYSLTQTDNDVTMKDSKILSYGIRKGEESKLHELFANRTHNFYDPDDEEESFEKIYDWIVFRLNEYDSRNTEENDLWSQGKKSKESIEAYSERNVILQDKNLSLLVSKAKSIRCVGISNNELSSRIDSSALINALNNGASIEILFLDPNGKYTKLREEEEKTLPDRIKNNTSLNIEIFSILRKDLSEEANKNLLIKMYDLEPRFNILIIDNLALLQYYANFLPGNKNPTFSIERCENDSPLYEFCERCFNEISKHSKEIEVKK